jgi:hypothetical protein
MASAVVRSGPEPEKLARTRAAAQMVVERGMFAKILRKWVELSISELWNRGHDSQACVCET